MPATLALTLGSPATFGAFTPGVAQDYTASTTANVISIGRRRRALDRRPERDGAGPPRQRRVRAPERAAGARDRRVRADGARRRRCCTWNAPVSNQPVPLEFKQTIGATDALRTGTYSKTARR